MSHPQMQQGQPRPEKRPILVARDLHFAYPGGDPILQGVSLHAQAGEVLALLGANGSGKSTLLKLLLGLLPPDQGDLELQNRPLASWSRREIAQRMAYVPQAQAMPFPYRVVDVVALGRIAQRGLLDPLTPEDRAVAKRVMARLEIDHLAQRPYTSLSGGQRQLCLIARALAQESMVIVMDEPDGGLDYGNQWRLLDLVQALAAEGRVFILSSHHPEHVLGHASRAILLHGGRVLADGKPSEAVSPAHVRQLYGLEVGRHRLADGRTVLVPEAGGARHA